MDKGIFATVEHRRLMELKNCGAVDVDKIDEVADKAFFDLREQIINSRDKPHTFFGNLAIKLRLDLGLEDEVKLMFSFRKELIEHLQSVTLPTKLCPITDSDKERLMFLDRAYNYAVEAQKVLDMFKRHHEVIVDSDRSLVIDWILQNSARIRSEINKGV